jgi:PleD family two-component response regulator
MEQKKIILAIDDMATDLASLRAVIDKKFDVRVSRSAGTAMKMLETIQVDLVLLDIEMPGMSGFEFLHALRKNPSKVNIPVIVVSSHSSEEFFSHAKKQGADGCIAKPVNPEELLEKMNFIFENPPEHKMADLFL